MHSLGSPFTVVLQINSHKITSKLLSNQYRQRLSEIVNQNALIGAVILPQTSSCTSSTKLNTNFMA